MKQNKLFLGLATLFAATFTFAACSSDDAETQNAQQKINFVYKSAAGTRTATDPQSGTSVATGLNVGIFGVSSEGTTTTMTNYTNTKYVTASGNALNYAGDTDKEMTWPTATSATASIYAYAPYQEGWTNVSGENTFTVGEDQSDDSKYLASDLLYASATDQPNGSTVALAFGHKLAKVNITITKATDSNVNLANATVSITGTKRVAKFTPSTGAVAVDEGATASDILALTIGSDLTAGDANSKATACAVVVPQDLAAETAFVKIVTSDSKTLIGKLSSAATLASNGTYSMNISVGNVTEAETIVKVSFGTTSLVAWGADTPIGLTAYGVGDYVLKDGTFIKAADYDANSANVAAIIFSTSVSETDGNAGYNAYAMGLSRRNGRTFPNLEAYKAQVLTTAVTGYYAGYSDLDGRTKTAQMLAHEFYTSGLDDSGKSSFVANMSGYTPAFTETAKNATTGTVSDWFLPSFGQMRQILSEFGGVTFVVSGEEDPSGTNTGHTINGTALNSWGSNNPFYTSAENALTTLVTNLNSHVSGMFAEGNICFATSTENGGSGHVNKFWFIGTSGSSKTYWMGKGMQRGSTVPSGNNYNTIPVVAVKLPTE